ncbi:MAG: M28 family metallopeptidase [Erysipelotrichaceae bacterium]|nr:M28 family metallopeptidase [Erysipelotrichaceae bacterium]
MYGQYANEVLSRLSFRRFSGSEEEYAAAKLIASEIEKIGFKPEIEEFTFEVEEPIEAKLSVNGKDYPVSGSYGAGNCENETAEVYYLQNYDDVCLKEVKDKLVILSERASEENFKELVQNGMKAYMLINGSIKDSEGSYDLDSMRYKESFAAIKKVPCFTIHVKDALEIMADDKPIATYSHKTAKKTIVSHNVITRVEGSDPTEDELVIGAHYDSTRYSYGAWDNGAGSVKVLSFLKYLKEHPLKRSVTAIHFGSEEVGLKGSRAFAEKHQDIIDKCACMVNLDMGGNLFGKNICIVTGVSSIEGYITCLANEVGYSTTVSSRVMSSDSAVFSDYGVPTIALGRTGAQGSAFMHTRYDEFKYISAKELDQEIDFLLELMTRLGNAVVFPFPRVIPEELRGQVIKYFGAANSHLATMKNLPNERKKTEFKR